MSQKIRASKQIHDYFQVAPIFVGWSGSGRKIVVPLRQVSVWNLFIGAAPVTSNEHVRWEIVRWGVGSLHVEKLVELVPPKKNRCFQKLDKRH